MIEINLLPEESKIKTAGIGKLSIEPKYLLYSVPLIFALLILIHTLLAIMLLARNVQLASLNHKWQALRPRRELVSNLSRQYDALAQDVKLIEELNRRRLNWSEKLNRLSLDLPSGVWFNELLITAKDFTLKGSAVSLQKEEMSLINNFIDRLKNDPHFLRDFNKLELASVKKRSVGGYDIIDFSLTAKLKSR